MKRRYIVISLLVVVIVLIGGVSTSKILNNQSASAPSSSSSSSSVANSSATKNANSSSSSNSQSKKDASSSASSKKAKSSSSSSSSNSSSSSSSSSIDSANPDVKAPVVTPASDDAQMRKPINWRLSSETKPYPNVNAHPNLWIHVSTERQRVFIMDGSTLLYTMYASTGDEASGNGTPHGTFHIQAQRGKSFYNPRTLGGANNWVSFLGHGVYLFHSVPIYENGQYILSEAAKLGQKGASHGCVRLSVPDSAWFYGNIKFNTKVVID